MKYRLLSLFNGYLVFSSEAEITHQKLKQHFFSLLWYPISVWPLVLDPDSDFVWGGRAGDQSLADFSSMSLKYEMQNGHEVCSITCQHSYKTENTHSPVTSVHGVPQGTALVCLKIKAAEVKQHVYRCWEIENFLGWVWFWMEEEVCARTCVFGIHIVVLMQIFIKHLASTLSHQLHFPQTFWVDCPYAQSVNTQEEGISRRVPAQVCCLLADNWSLMVHLLLSWGALAAAEMNYLEKKRLVLPAIVTHKHNWQAVVEEPYWEPRCKKQQHGAMLSFWGISWILTLFFFFFFFF